MLKRITTLLLLTLSILTIELAYARPYHGDIFTFYQPDGQEFQVRLFGDEYYVVIESLDAYTLTKDITTGFYCYAKTAPDGMSFISTGIKAGQPLPPGILLKKKSRLSRNAIKQKSEAARKKFGVDSKGKLLPAQHLRLRPQDFGYKRWVPALEQQAQTLEGLQMSIQPGPPSTETTGTRVGLVLLAQFPDRPDDVTVSQSQVDAYANDPSYTGFSNATSVYGYFNIQSNGKLQYNCIVTSYFTAVYNRDYYTDNTIEYGTRAKELINEGLAVLKAKGFDFTKADANNDSVLDGVNIFYAGSRVNNWAEGLWPHKWSSYWGGLSAEGVSPNFQYQISNIGYELSLGTFCHENGHMICNFPDLYSYNGNAAEINSYSLMSSSGSKHPVSIDAYLKIHAGWSNVIDITSASKQRGAVEVDKNTFYRYRNPAEPREYFLLSLRTDSGYEGIYGGTIYSVNPTDGLVIWHAREHGSNTYSSIFTQDYPTDYTTPYELMVVEANPSSATTPWYDDPNPGSNDAYHSGDVNTASDSTIPALKFWNTSTGRTTTSNMNLHSVSAQGDVITFTVGTAAVTGSQTIETTSSTLDPSCNFETDAASQTFAVFNSGGGTLSYSVSDNVSWLSINPSSGTATTEADQITVTYDTDALSPGTYNGTITITDGGATNSPQTIPVTLTVHQQAVIGLAPSSLSKTLPTTGSSATDSFTLSNNGGGTLYYTLSEPASWIQLTSTAGTVTAEEDEIGVTFDASTLSEGIYTTAITISSSNAANSPQTIDVTLTVGVPLPDLVVISTYVSDSSLTPNHSYTLSATTENQGTATADSTTIRYYLSDNSTINMSDTLLATSPVNSLAPGTTSTENVTVTAPATEGTYWVGSCVEVVPDESNTANQCSSGVQITVTTVTQPDLVVISTYVSDSSLTPNHSYTLSATTENQGTATADSTTIRYYLSDNSTINMSDTLLATSPVNSLAPGTTSTENVTVTAPATGGTYWVGACVDVVADESNTANQCSTGIPVKVGSFSWPLFLPAITGKDLRDSM